MKKNYFILLAAALLFGACDRIENPVTVAKNKYRDDLYGPAPTFNTTTEANRNVLFEEFTGHLCGFCPPSTALALELDAQLGERMVTVAIHAGSLAATGGTLFQTDYTTPVGNVYWAQLNGGFNPTARIDRLGGLSSYEYLDPANPSSWQSIVTNRLNVSTPVALQANCEYVAADNVLNIHMNSQFIGDYTGNVNLVVLLVENHIISAQEDYSQTPSEIEEYEHEHVLRTNVTEPMGNLVINSPSTGYSSTNSFTIPLQANWVPTNMTVVGYLVDANSHEVLNAIEYEIN
ncbi:MAG: hypothetical protein RLZZ91_1677 [Bacteroidota bacterium]|jgi:hypothetical protein